MQSNQTHKLPSEDTGLGHEFFLCCLSQQGSTWLKKIKKKIIKLFNFAGFSELSRARMMHNEQFFKTQFFYVLSHAKDHWEKNLSDADEK